MTKPNVIDMAAVLKDKNLLNAIQPDPEIIEPSFMDFLSQESLFDADECKKIIALADDMGEGKVNASETDDTAVVSDWRSSKNQFIKPDENNFWLFDKLLAIGMTANQYYQFDVNYFDAVQVSKYEPGDHYDWHVDAGPGRMGNRKLSMSVQLSAPHDYEGGDLVLQAGEGRVAATRELGSVIVFPSFVSHKVEQVLDGTRYSLVVWMAGERRFR